MNQEKSKNDLINWELVAINPNEKKWDWKDLFFFWANNIQSIIAFSLIASLYIVYELNYIIVFFGTLIGSLFVCIFANLIGSPSQKYGLPFPVILRTSFGIKAAKYFAMSRGIVGIFMFGVQTYFLSKAFSYLIRVFFYSIDNTILNNEIFLIFLLGLNIIDWCSFLIVIFLQIYLFSRSFKFNRVIIKICAIIVYLGMLIFFLLILAVDHNYVFEAFVNIFKYNNIFEKNNLIPLTTVAGTMFAYFSIVLVNYGDFTCYVKNDKELKKGNLSLILNLIIFSFFAVFIVIGSDVILSKKSENIDKILTNPTDIIGKFDSILITLTALFFILFSSASTNLIANYVPAQNALLNLLPTKIDLRKSSLIIAFFSFLIGIFWLTFFSRIGIFSLIDSVGSFFGPIFGIIIVNYYLINKSQINNKDIFSSETTGSYYFSNGWHLKAIYCLFLGFIFASATIWNVNLMFLQPYSWIIGAFISSFTYYLLA